eukprot:833547-Pelagomonas_calceolata.AAC.4
MATIRSPVANVAVDDGTAAAAIMAANDGAAAKFMRGPSSTQCTIMQEQGQACNTQAGGPRQQAVMQRLLQGVVGVVVSLCSAAEGPAAVAAAVVPIIAAAAAGATAIGTSMSSGLVCKSPPPKRGTMAQCSSQGFQLRSAEAVHMVQSSDLQSDGFQIQWGLSQTCLEAAQCPTGRC